MIETKKYLLPENFDKRSIGNLHFMNRAYEMQTEKDIQLLDTNFLYSFCSLHMDPGLSVIIDGNSNVPVIVYGDPQNFKEGISVLEKLLETKLTEVKK